MHLRFRHGVRAGRVVAVAGVLVMGSVVAMAAPASAAGDPPPPSTTNCLTASPRQCYSVGEFRAAYGVQPLLDRGFTGRGQTVVLPEFDTTPNDPGASDVRADLALFDRTFGLPDARINVVNSIAHNATPFLASGEELGDAELVHEVAPDATIDVLLLPNFTTDPVDTQVVVDNYARALRLAPSLGSVVSISAGLGERCWTPAQSTEFDSALREARAHHETVIVSSGDSGAADGSCANGTAPVKGVEEPGSDPNVLSVGGSKLDAAHPSGRYLGESVWNEPVPAGWPREVEPQTASGGGFSDVFAKPGYQRGIAAIGAHRGVPDVAASADTRFGPAVAAVVCGESLIKSGGGTSAGAPFWAGLVALANQAAHRPLGFVNPAIYRIAESPLYHAAFHDITVGNNSVDYPLGSVTGYAATPGWDPATGWGTPDASVLVPLLAASGEN